MVLDSLPASRRLVVALGACASLGPPRRALAARGAAELDLEYYARSLLGKSAPPELPSVVPVPARLLDHDLSAALLKETAAAVAYSLDLTTDELNKRASASRTRLALEFDRVLSAGAFSDGFDAAFTTAANEPQAQNQQYAFDLTVCTIFSLVADARLSRAARRALDERLGIALLRALAGGTALSKMLPTFGAVSLGVKELLARLERGGYVRSFIVDDSDADEALWAE